MARRPARAPITSISTHGWSGGCGARAAAQSISSTTSGARVGKCHPVSMSLALREDRYIGDPVVAVVDNLLPDNDDIRRRVAERAHADGADAHSLLSAIGRDCIGALQFLPDGAAPGAAGAIDGRAASDQEIAAILGNLASNPLGIGPDQDFSRGRARKDSAALLERQVARASWHDRNYAHYQAADREVAERNRPDWQR
ncbi:HipA N-terminal domain-containing protein [Bradyrhizobium sp. CB1650]|uniref:HipA N-terminal domain-containing protein n=1 Tax=Bradyrhizobium sp. CB1650 TaxID=3039153 RepID=UPI0024349503|nr:HipA N-terminal domain-containing protein [Bradyrhizobium sp. CB1650]WGD50986.1 HipA N-terminal domain-containing protein [Bradyrhizobium sp. CB1650]